MPILNRKAKDQKFVDSKSKAQKLYGQTPMWLAMLKAGGTGILMSFMMALFTFVDQLMLVNLMPTTHAYDFAALFLYTHDNVFAPLFGDTALANQATVTAVANATGLGLFNAADIVRSAVSLSAALIFLVQSFPAIATMGVVILYSKFMGGNQIDKAQLVWKNSVVAAILSGLIGFVVLIILIPTVTPAQATKTDLNLSQITGLGLLVEQNLLRAGYTPLFNQNGVETIYTNGIQSFGAVLNPHHHLMYVSLNHGSLLKAQNYVFVNPDTINGKLTEVSFTSQTLLTTWNNYFKVVQQDSIAWAEHFLYIMDAGIILQCFSTLFIGALRGDGEIKFTTIVTVLTIAINIALDYVLIRVAQIGMEGAATASIIGFVIQLVLLVAYIQFSHTTHLKFQAWSHLQVDWKQILAFAKIGLNRLVGAVGSMVLMILLTKEITFVSEQLLPAAGSEYYISIMGAVMPFVTLFFASIGGFARNAVQIYSFNYGNNHQKRVREAYWYTFIYILVLGLLVFGLFGCCDPIKAGLLSWFHITSQTPGGQLASSEKLMLMWMSEVPIFALMVNAMIVFLVANWVKTSIFVALLRTIIIPLPILYIFGAIALHGFGANLTMIPDQNPAMWFFMGVAPTYTAVYSAVLFIMSTVFIYRLMFKRQQTIQANEVLKPTGVAEQEIANPQISVDSVKMTELNQSDR